MSSMDDSQPKNEFDGLTVDELIRLASDAQASGDVINHDLKDALVAQLEKAGPQLMMQLVETTTSYIYDLLVEGLNQGIQPDPLISSVSEKGVQEFKRQWLDAANIAVSDESDPRYKTLIEKVNTAAEATMELAVSLAASKLKSDERQYLFKARESSYRTDAFAFAVAMIPRQLESGDWHPTPDGRGMESTIPGSSLIEKVVYSPLEIPEPSYENWEEEERRRVDAMLASIRNARLTPSDAVVMLYVIDQLIHSSDPSIYITLHELLDLEGIDNRRARAFNQEQADRYHRIFTLINQTKFFYRGEPRWVGKGEKKRKQVDAYESPAFVYGGRKATMQSRLPGLGAADNWEIHRFKYHLLPSQYIQSMQRDSSLSSWLGDLKAIARIPSGKARGNWAKAIATYLIPHARRNAKHDRNKIPIKRKTLFESVVMDPTPEKVLESDKPARAIQYFTEAMKELKSIGIISEWSDPTPAKNPPRGWLDGWMDQTIEIAMGKTYKEQMALIADKRRGSQKRLPKPPEKQDQG